MTIAFEILSEIREVERIAAGRGVDIRRYWSALTARVVGER